MERGHYGEGEHEGTVENRLVLGWDVSDRTGLQCLMEQRAMDHETATKHDSTSSEQRRTTISFSDFQTWNCNIGNTSWLKFC